MSDFLAFRRMITPLIVQVVFWVGTVASVVAGLIMITGDFTERYGSARGTDVLLGLAVLLVGPLLIRVYCELLILAFRMNETLSDIRTSLTGSDE